MVLKNQVMNDGTVLSTHIFEPTGKQHRGVAVATNSQAQHILNLAPTLSGLAKHGWQVHGVDLRGHGRSASNAAPLAHMEINQGWELLISDFKQSLELAFAGVPWEDRLVVAPNIGAPLLLEVLKEWPDLAKRLVMISPPSDQPILNRLARSFMKVRLLFNPADKPDELTMHQMYLFLSAQLKDRKRLIDIVSSDRQFTDMLLNDKLAWPTPTTGYFYEMFRGIEQAWKQVPNLSLRKGTELLVIYGNDDPMTASGKFVKNISNHFNKMGLTSFSSHCIEGGRSGLFSEDERFNISGAISDWASTENRETSGEYFEQENEKFENISTSVLENLGIEEYEQELTPDALVELCYNAIDDENRWIEMLYKFAFALSDDKGLSNSQLETLVSVLMPHWDRSHKLNRQILNNAVIGAVLQNVIDRFEIGLAILDSDFNIVYANSSFSQALDILSTDQPANIDEPNNQALTTRLMPHLSSSFLSTASGENEEAVLVVNDKVVGFYFKPSALKQTALNKGGASGALILHGIIDDRQDTQHIKQQILEFAYGMTSKEAQVANYIISGKSPAYISEKMNVSIHTTRTHLKRVFDKASVQGQSELIAKMLNSPFGLLR